MRTLGGAVDKYMVMADLVVLSDAELVGVSVGGDRRAFAVLIGRHERDVHAFLARRAGRAAAEDLLADVWAAALGAQGRYDRSCLNARPWLFGIARNVLRAYLRRCGSGPLPSPMVLDPWDEVDGRLDGAEAVKAAVRGLSDEERDVLLLVVWEQLTPGEAAVVLAIPPGTARSRLHRARVVLRERIDGSTQSIRKGVS